MEAILQKKLFLLSVYQKITSIRKSIFIVLNALIRLGKGDTRIGKTYMLGQPKDCPDY